MESAAGFSARDYCRVGDYRRGLIQSLRERKQNGSYSMAMALALIKTKRPRHAISVLIQLAISNPNDADEAASLAAQAIKNLEPSKSDIDFAASSLHSIILKPFSLALIAANIKSQDARSFFIESHISLLGLDSHRLELMRAYIAYLDDNHKDALSIAQSLSCQDARDIEATNLVATILLHHNYTYEARRFACRSLRADPKDTRALQILGVALYKEARWRPARRVFKILHSVLGDDLSLCNSLIAPPPIALSTNSLPEAIEGFKNLEKLVAQKPNLMGIEKSLSLFSMMLPSEFFLPYAGPISVRHNLEVARGFIRLSAQGLVHDIKSYYELNPPRIAVRNQHKPINFKIRIAFISRFFSFHSNHEAHRGLIANLDRKRFHIILIHRSGSSVDEVHLSLNKCADQVIYLENDFGDSCRRILELNLDILFFTDVGMTPLDYVLAMPHLARRQCTSWGLPHTTGVREIDYHLRSKIFSDCEDQSEYTEALVETNGYFGYFDRTEYKLNVLSRDYFMLPPDRFLIGCLQTLHKIHPDFDSYLEDIASIDESIMIVICPSESDFVMEKYVNRIKRSAPTAYRQLCILKRTNLDEFYSLNNLLDLNLDTIYYGAGISFVQTTWCGPPYVTEFGNQVRSAVVSRSYQYANINNPPIAHDKFEYINLVKKYFENRDELAALRAEIHQKSEGTIYNNETYLRSCEEAFASFL